MWGGGGAADSGGGEDVVNLILESARRVWKNASERRGRKRAWQGFVAEKSPATDEAPRDMVGMGQHTNTDPFLLAMKRQSTVRQVPWTHIPPTDITHMTGSIENVSESSIEENTGEDSSHYDTYVDSPSTCAVDKWDDGYGIQDIVADKELDRDEKDRGQGLLDDDLI